MAIAVVQVTAVAWIQSLAQELLYAMSIAMKKKKNSIISWDKFNQGDERPVY